MTLPIKTLAAALGLAIATLAPARAAEADRGFVVPAVLGIGYHVAGVAMDAADVRRQGGFPIAVGSRAGAARTVASPAEPFMAPGVVTVAFRDPRIASDAAGVMRQRGFATAGAARWLPSAEPVTDETDAGKVRVGAL